MTLDALLFAASLAFLLGIVMMLLASLPPFAGRFRRLFGWGFLLTVAAVAGAAAAALLLP